MYAKLRTDLVVASTIVDGETVYNMKDPIRGTYFRLRTPEFWLVQQLDGVTSYDQIADQFRAKFEMNISAENVEQFVQALEKLFFLDNARAEQAVSRKSYIIDKQGSLFSRLLFVKLKAFSPGNFLNRITSFYRPFHNRLGFALQAVTILLGLWILMTNLSQFSVSLHSIFNLSSILVVITALFIFFVVHEFAHAVICHYYGGEVHEMGFLLLYFQPCFYCDLSDAWLFKEKRHRLAVTAAGPYFQLILMAVALIVWRITMIGGVPNDLARIIVIISWVTLLLNLNPLIKLDGYYLLSDWLDIPNLRRKSFAYLGHRLKSSLLGWPVEPIDVSLREKRIFLWYSVFAVLYSGFLLSWVLSLIASFLLEAFGASGLLLLVAFLFVILRQSIVQFARGIIKHLKFMKTLYRKPWRLIGHLIIASSVVVVMLAVPFPKRVTGEVLVRPIAECRLRLNDVGQLETVYRRGGKDADRKTSFLQAASTDMASLILLRLVKDGQLVKEGDSVAVLVSNQISKEIIAETSVLEKANSELDLLMAPPKQEAVAEAQAQVTAARTDHQQRYRELERTTELASKNLITTSELEAAESEVSISASELTTKEASLQLLMSGPKPEEIAVLQAEINKQDAKLAFLRSQQAAQTIRAPMSGRVDLGLGEELVLSIVDDSQVELLVPVSDFDIRLVEYNQKVQLKVRSHSGEVFVGRVALVPLSAQSTDNEAIFPVSVIVDNSEGRLRNGMTGFAKIECGESSLISLIGRKVASEIRVEFWSWW